MSKKVLSRDEILAMEPGRELDALVGGSVMNLDLVDDCLPYLPKHYVPEFNRTIFTDVPKYSTDISAAWEVVEKLRLIVSPNNNGGWKAGRMDGARLERYHVIWSHRWAFADTPPEAICKAALLAVINA